MAQWLSCYLRGRQAKTCFKGVKSTSRKINTSIPQGSKLSPSLFSFYIADMPRPTDLVKQVCYAGDLTMWASRVNILDLEVSLNNYLDGITAYLMDNTFLILPQILQLHYSPQIHTKPRPILVYSSRIYVCHWLNAQGYCESTITPLYHSTSTSIM